MLTRTLADSTAISVLTTHVNEVVAHVVNGTDHRQMTLFAVVKPRQLRIAHVAKLVLIRVCDLVRFKIWLHSFERWRGSFWLRSPCGYSKAQSSSSSLHVVRGLGIPDVRHVLVIIWSARQRGHCEGLRGLLCGVPGMCEKLLV